MKVSIKLALCRHLPDTDTTTEWINTIWPNTVAAALGDKDGGTGNGIW